VSIEYNATRAGYNNNWGDCIAPILFEWLSGRRAKVYPSLHGIARGNDRILLMLGSVMKIADSKSGVWGIGYINEKYRFREPPLAVYAVRGPLTRQRLLTQGVECPEVFGDPALLFSRLYPRPERMPHFELGIVPHYIDKDALWLRQFKGSTNVKVIDVQQEVFSFVDEVCDCATILSSSLHGVICADAYSIPNMWIELSDRVVGKGFKFRDYMWSVNRRVSSAFSVEPAMPVKQVLDAVRPEPITIDLDLLMEVCPIRSKP
jgi:pyruvyltransferase